MSDCPFCSSDSTLERSPRSTRLAGVGHGRPVELLPERRRKKSAGDQARIARVRVFACIPSQDSDRFGLAFRITPYGAIHLRRNGDIQYPRGSIVRERITKIVSMTRCTCERCGHTWDVPDDQKIQCSCPSRACRSPLWDKPITRQGVSDFAKAARPKDWAARRARGWRHPSSKS